MKFSRSGDFEKAARAFDLTGVSSCIDFHSHKKLLLRPQEWRLQLRFQCRQWENGDGKIRRSRIRRRKKVIRRKRKRKMMVKYE